MSDLQDTRIIVDACVALSSVSAPFTPVLPGRRAEAGLVPVTY